MSFERALAVHGLEPMVRESARTLQLNLKLARELESGGRS